MEEKPDNQATPVPAMTAVDELRLQHLRQEIRDNQNLLMATIAGFGAAILGAGAWALVTNITGYQIGFMAIGVGFLVGYAVRLAGKGIDNSFGIVGATMALLGCAGGNLLNICLYLADMESMGLADVIAALNSELIVELMTETFDPMDVLFYGIAAYEGFKISIKPVVEEGLNQPAV